ncbi:hypothetical protein [Mycolicibacter algericus]|uniref:Uncharacterized protein n=2 Tax=Mycolicibacter algericus TaxID=1288388 RepID=A0A7I9Y444_MYCAL|nr:hypothetical protein [Mycolicibacter algericus]OQZ96920.1 hypothetical protein BST10_10105 [Mycolicibacter algericus DSM 45454]GFG83384.1 hypothetical protein MALGJ_00600 [Mycolicibacter algericus]
MQHRCVGGFTYRDRVIAGGALIEDGDPILATHADHFVAVAEPSTPGGETASTDRRRSRNERRGAAGRPVEKNASEQQDAPEMTLLGGGGAGEAGAEGDDSP